MFQVVGMYDKFLDVEDEDEVDDGSMKPLA